MGLTIDKKVGLFISLLIFVFGSVLGVYFVRTQTDLLRHELEERAFVILHDLVVHLEYPMLVGDIEAITHIVHKALTHHDVARCRVVGKDGVLLVEQGLAEETALREFSAPIVARHSEAAEDLILNVPRAASEQVGTVTLSMSLAGLQHEIHATRVAVAAVIIIALLLAILGTWLLLQRLVGRPVTQLVAATERIGGGDLTTRVPLTADDEFGVLAAAFNRMTGALQDARESLLRKEKLATLGQVAGSVGHELRNPLGVMSNAIYYLKMVLTDADPTIREYLDMISAEIAGAERIVADLLDAVRTRPPEAQTVPVEELIRQALKRCSVPEQIAVQTEIAAELVPVTVDPQQMMQVFRNLISNGLDAMNGTGRLLIRAATDADGHAVRVDIQDTGVGMTLEQLAKLFQPLFTTKARGIGLGLVVVKNLVEANGGRIEVQSTVGAGSTFTLILNAGAMPQAVA